MGDRVDRRKAAREIHGLDVGATGGEIAAHVRDVFDAQGQEFSLVVERELAFGDGVARVVVGHQRFRPRRHPMYGAVGDPGGDEQCRIFRVDRCLQPERAADIFRQYVELLALQAHHRGKLIAQGGRALRAAAQMVAVVLGVIARGGAARFHRRAVDRLICHSHASHRLGRSKNPLDFFCSGAILVDDRTSPVERDVA